MSFRTLPLEDFLEDRASYGEIVHIKGFGSGVKAARWQHCAMGYVGQSCSTIAWDGDSIKDDGFTALLPIFLSEDPNRKAIVFKQKNKIDTLQEKLKPLAGFMDRVFIIPIDIEEGKRIFSLEPEEGYVSNFPKNAHEFFFLGRIGLKATASKKVVAVGGGGIAGCEANASFVDSVKWIVLAVGRGKRETNPTLLDWARNATEKKNPCIDLDFIQGIDPDEKDGFKGGKKKSPLHCMSWCR